MNSIPSAPARYSWDGRIETAQVRLFVGRLFWLLLLGVGGFLAVAEGHAQEQRFEAESHLRGTNLPSQLEYTRTPRRAHKDRIVERAAPRSWREAGTIDADLSNACRRQVFRLRRPMRFRATFEDGILGVAFGHGLNLVDREGLADPAMTYYFRNANSTACLVLRTPNQDPRVQAALTGNVQTIP